MRGSAGGFGQSLAQAAVALGAAAYRQGQRILRSGEHDPLARPRHPRVHELAAGHAARARAALRRAEESAAKDSEQDTGIAMRELARALALEPANQQHVAAFAEVMSAQPSAVPPELSARLEAQTQSVIRAGARYTGYGVLVWFLFLPILVGLGVRRLDHVLAIVVPLLLSAALSFTAARQRPIELGLDGGVRQPRAGRRDASARRRGAGRTRTDRCPTSSRTD